MRQLSYFDCKSREEEARKGKESIERLRNYCNDTTEGDFDFEAHMKSYAESYRLRQGAQKEWDKLSPVELFNYYEQINEICNSVEEKEFIENKQVNNELTHIILENRLGFQLPIKAELIEDYIIPVTDKSKHVCDYFILIMKFKDIEQLEVGAMEFLKKAQIFNVYSVYKDGRQEKIAVPWSNDYMDMVNSLQVVTVGQDEIIIEIGV